MELHFNELDVDDEIQQNQYQNKNKQLNNTNTNEPYLEQSNEWQNYKNRISSKKKVSFNDILSNMNLVVNKTGVLQFMSPIQEETQKQEQEQCHLQEQKQCHKQNQQQNQSIKNIQLKQPTEQFVNHSYIFNKYFKNYKVEDTSTPEVKVPKTIQEYKQMVMEHKLKVYKERQRIAQIKSTKMSFTQESNTYSNINTKTNTNLRTMSFR